jgi:uroporphyrinogen decarboxylase
VRKLFLSHRERVVKALNHEEPDRVPFDLGGRVSTMMQNAYFKLKNALQLELVDYERISQDWLTVEEFDERVLQRFDIDFRRVFLKSAEGYKKIVQSDGSWVDEMGFIRKIFGGYGEITYHSLRDAKTVDDIRSYKFPDPYDPYRTHGLRERVGYLYNSTDYAIVGAGAVGGLLETCFWFRGYEQFAIDLMSGHSLVHTLLRKLTDYYLSLMDVFLSCAGDYMQIIEMADDVGTQIGPLISPKLYKKMILPYYKELLGYIKSKTKAKIFHHSCGSMIEMTPILLEAGIDILNSLQPRAYMMDSTYLKDNYGDKLSFHGGIDIQQVMPYGTHEDVEEEVKRRIAIYAPGGGYILCCAHDILDDVPFVNAITLYDCANKWGKYPLVNELTELRKKIKN